MISKAPYWVSILTFIHYIQSTVNSLSLNTWGIDVNWASWEGTKRQTAVVVVSCGCGCGGCFTVWMRQCMTFVRYSASCWQVLPVLTCDASGCNTSVIILHAAELTTVCCCFRYYVRIFCYRCGSHQPISQQFRTEQTAIMTSMQLLAF